MKESDLTIRLMEEQDIPNIVKPFEQLGWHKPESLYKQYWMEQSLKTRDVYVVFVKDEFAGYLTICWISPYKPFRDKNIPEVVDFIVLPKFRRMGIGTKLMDKAEREISRVSSIAGIGVGMTPDYGAAQRMYVLRGYIPDGLGLHWRDHYPQFGEVVKMDDDLALYFTKELK